MKQTTLYYTVLIITIFNINCASHNEFQQYVDYENVKMVRIMKKYKKCFDDDKLRDVLYQKGIDSLAQLYLFPFDYKSQKNNCSGLWLGNYSHLPYGMFHAIKILYLKDAIFTRRNEPVEDAIWMFNSFIEYEHHLYSDTTLLRLKYSFISGDITSPQQLVKERTAPIDSIRIWLYEIEKGLN